MQKGEVPLLIGALIRHVGACRCESDLYKDWAARHFKSSPSLLTIPPFLLSVQGVPPPPPAAVCLSVTQSCSLKLLSGANLHIIFLHKVKDSVSFRGVAKAYELSFLRKIMFSMQKMTTLMAERTFFGC